MFVRFCLIFLSAAVLGSPNHFQVFSRPVCAGYLAAVVDPYSTGAYLARELKSQGATVLAIKSSRFPGATYFKSFHPEDFRDGDIIEAEDFPSHHHLVAYLKARGLQGVLAGAETGVETADLLNHSLGFKGNDIQKISAHREKDSMQVALGEFAIPTRTFQDYESALLQAEQWGDWNLNQPLVVKPVRAAGGNGVTFVRNAEELRLAVEKIFKSQNNLGEDNLRFILQRFVSGPEYAVNVVSVDGEHLVTDIWQYKRRPLSGAGSGYLYDTLLPYAGEAQEILRNYFPKVAKKLGIQNGVSHFEIILSPLGPQLIEVATRPCGGGLPFTAGRVSSLNPLFAMAKSLLAPEDVLKINPRYELIKQVVVVFLSSTGRGKISFANQNKIKSLPGFDSLDWFVQEGDLAPRTEDAGGVIGRVLLIGDSLEKLHESANHIIRLQDEGAWQSR